MLHHPLFNSPSSKKRHTARRGSSMAILHNQGINTKVWNVASTAKTYFPLARFLGDVFSSSEIRAAADGGDVTLPAKISGPVTFLP
jgi:hypothetical protein